MVSRARARADREFFLSSLLLRYATLREKKEIVVCRQNVRERQKVDSENNNRLHTLSADELYAAHLTPFLQQATETLRARLQSSQQENQRLMERVVAQRAEIERLVGGVEGVVRDLEGSVEVMGGGVGRGVEGLRAEVWEMEGEVKASSG